MRVLAALPALAISALALAACAGGGGPVTGADPLPAASAFERVAAPAATFDTPLAAAQSYARYAPGDEGSSMFDLVSRQQAGPGTLVMVFAVGGYADDSVAGEQWRIELSRAAGGWRVTNAGRRQKCYRGADAGEWQAGPCP